MKETIVQFYGRCEDISRHSSHLFRYEDYGTHISVSECRGVYVDCLNCDDRKCMDCVSRYVHDRCEDSCPDCCEENR